VEGPTFRPHGCKVLRIILLRTVNDFTDNEDGQLDDCSMTVVRFLAEWLLLTNDATEHQPRCQQNGPALPNVVGFILAFALHKEDLYNHSRHRSSVFGSGQFRLMSDLYSFCVGGQ
jgi:hypothetical protein